MGRTLPSPKTVPLRHRVGICRPHLIHVPWVHTGLPPKPAHDNSTVFTARPRAQNTHRDCLWTYLWGLRLPTSCKWTRRRYGSRCSPRRTCGDRRATWGSCSSRGRSCRRETRRESPERASCPTTTPSWTDAAAQLRLDSLVRRPPATHSAHSKPRTSALNMTLPAAAARAHAAIDPYMPPVLWLRQGCCCALWRQRQIWIERRLLSTRQTDGRTDTRPLRRPGPAITQ